MPQVIPYNGVLPISNISQSPLEPTDPISTTMNSMTEYLPPATSENLKLCEQSEAEKRIIWKLNGQVWRGRLSMEAYIRREEHLGNQALTRHGGITYWVLTDPSQPPNKRPLLASCESLAKRALVKEYDGRVEEVLSHGIGSVFCDPKLRGRGYAKRMIEELGQRLDNWKQTDGRRTLFTVLYSDIGKVRRAGSMMNGGQMLMSF